MKVSRFPQLFVPLFLAACFTLGSGTTLAAVPQTLNYQGFLTNKTTGAPLSATVSVTFKLYDALTAGTLLYTETQPTVTVTNGIFNVQIGMITPLSPVPFDKPYWLEVTVGTDTLQPRQPLASSGYAKAAGNIVTQGLANTAVGFNALNSNTSGSYNTANGQLALFSNTTGYNNTVTGAQAFYSNTTGYFNTVTGTQALFPNTTGFDNTANGMQALFNSTTGSDNTAVGMQAGYYNTTGSLNTATGSSALRANTTGSNNIGLGANGGAALTTGSFNIDIGNTGIAAESNTIRIGSANQTRTFVAGIRGTTTGSSDTLPVVIDSTGQLGTGQISASQIVGSLSNATVPGVAPWTVVPTTTTLLQTASNTAYVLNSATQTTLTLPGNPNPGDVVKVTSPGIGGFQIRPNSGQLLSSSSLTSFGGTVWAVTTAPSLTWTGIASSTDGTHLAAVAYGGGIYVSVNGGATWSPTSAPIVGGAGWNGIASSSDGTHLAAIGNGLLVISADSGTTWRSPTVSIPSGVGFAITSSADGTHLAAVTVGVPAGSIGGVPIIPQNGGIFTSADSGATWHLTPAPSTTTVNWAAIASSPDGTHLAAVIFDGGIYTSADSGATWKLTAAPTTLPSAPTFAMGWAGIATSPDGTRLAAVSNFGGIYTSADGGATWLVTSAPTGTVFWRSIASSSDFTHLAAVCDGAVYLSTDSGASWTQAAVPGAHWQSIASSSDGLHLVAAIGSLNGGSIGGVFSYPGGGIYTAPVIPQVFYLVGKQNSSAELVYAGSGIWSVVNYQGGV